MAVRNNRGVFEIVTVEHVIFSSKEHTRKIYDSLPLLAAWSSENNEQVVLTDGRLLTHNFIALAKQYTGGLAQGRLDGEHRNNYDRLSTSFLDFVNNSDDYRVMMLIHHLADNASDVVISTDTKEAVMLRVVRELARIKASCVSHSSAVQADVHDDLQDVIDSTSRKSSDDIVDIIMDK